MQEKRHFKRVHFVSKSEIVISGATLEADVLDLSLRGGLFHLPLPEGISKGVRAHIRLTLAPSEVTLEFDAHLVHIEKDICGFEFFEMEMDAAAHLRRLIELNTADGEEVYQELSFLQKKPS